MATKRIDKRITEALSRYRLVINRLPARSMASLETPGITLLATVFGWLVNANDPFTQSGPFPWIILAPLLIGLRYGFFHALISCILLATLDWLYVHWQQLNWQVPVHWLLGLLTVSLIAGEFRDIWGRRLAQKHRANRYRQVRMAAFTRAYHVLEQSHHQLEQAIAMHGYSLYAAVQDLKSQWLAASKSKAPTLSQTGNRLMALFSHYGQVQIGALLAVNQGIVDVTGPIATLGQMPALSDDDPLILRAHKRLQTTFISPSLQVELTAPKVIASQLVACVPLADSNGVLYALLAIHLMPLHACHEQHMQQLAVLAGYMADLITLSNDAQAIPRQDSPDRAFHVQLLRCYTDAQQHGLAAGLIAITIQHWALAPALLDTITEYRNDLDVITSIQEPHHETRTVLLLMPLTEPPTVRQYVEQFPDFLQRHHKVDMVAAGVTLAHLLIGSDCTKTTLDAFLTRCGYLQPVPQQAAAAPIDNVT